MIDLRKNHYFLALIVLVITVAFAAWRSTKPAAPEVSGTVEALEASDSPLVSMQTETERVEENKPEDRMLVGVWFPYMSFTQGCDEAAFKAEFESKLETVKSIGANAVFVHVRPFADSLYPSEYEPWSHILTGEQGKDPGYDPLQIMVEAAHSKGLEFHAWINPLRISTGYTPKEYSPDSFYMQNRDIHSYWFMEYDGGVYYNPASAAVRERIAAGAAEIVENYNVEGIHFDDYFYPSDAESLDSAQYMAYLENTEEPLALHEWRTVNINALIASVYRRVKEINPDVVFGISPQGNLQNNEMINADVKTWCLQRGYIDYICPQLYFSFENEALPFETAMQQWDDLQRDEDISIYAGLAVYKAGTDADGGTWANENDILARQIECIRQKNWNGVILYAVEDLSAQDAAVEVEAVQQILRTNG